MREIKFRQLDASDIECRVARISDNGLQLLLYKDARCDMNILDESVGPANWQRSHALINGNLFCSVGINVINEAGKEPRWVWKQDVGTESNTEKEKGEASDSFKRACVNWGIGRELYSAPFIWIGKEKCRIEKNKKGNLYCKDDFAVGKIEYDEKRRISNLEILNCTTGEVVYPSRGKQKSERIEKEQPSAKETERRLVTADMISSLQATLKEAHVDPAKFLESNNMVAWGQMTVPQYKNTMDALNAKIEKRKEQENVDEGLPFA